MKNSNSKGVQEFQSTFLSTCEGKSTEQFCHELKGETETLIGRYLPTKTLSKGQKELTVDYPGNGENEQARRSLSNPEINK